MESCYKLRQLSVLLQSATRFITNCDRYYKVRWLLQIATGHRSFHMGVPPPPPTPGMPVNISLFIYIQATPPVHSQYMKHHETARKPCWGTAPHLLVQTKVELEPVLISSWRWRQESVSSLRKATKCTGHPHNLCEKPIDVLFYSKCTGFTVCLTHKEISLRMYINQC